MYSPRSVSTGSMPFAARWSLRPISSATIDLPLVTVCAPAAGRCEDDVARLGRGLGAVHLAAGGAHLVLVGLEVEVEMGERVVLDVARRVAQRLELGQRLDRLRRACSMKPARTWPAPSGAARRRARAVAFSLKAGEVTSISARAGSPIGGASVMPGQHLGDVPALHRRALRAAACRPCSCRQPRSPASSVSAPAAAIAAVFFSTMALEMSGYLTQNVPPKPQQTSASGISVELQARRPFQEPRAAGARRRARAGPSRNRGR